MLSSRVHARLIIILSVILLFVITGIGVFNLYGYYFPKVNEEAVSFFITSNNRIPDNENSLYALIGFNAPHDVVDIHKFGLDLVNQTLNQHLSTDKKHLPLQTNLPSFENELTLDIDANKLYCWLASKSSGSDSKCELDLETACYTPEELTFIIENNQVLLQRHEYLKKYTKYDNIALFSKNAPLLINTHRLFLADIMYLLRHGNEDAFISLVNDLKYRRAIMAQTGTLIDKAVNLVLYGLSLDQLDFAISHYNDIAHKYDSELKTVLSDLTIEEYGLDTIFREEFEIINSVFCIDEALGIKTNDYCQADINPDSLSANFVINDFYEVYLYNKNMLNLDFDTMVEQCNTYSNKEELNIYLDALLHLPIYRTYLAYSLLQDGMKKGCELMSTHKSKTMQHKKIRDILYGEAETSKQ